MINRRVSIAREVALEVLNKVLLQDSFANLALQQALRENLSAADRGLVTEIVYGTLKQRLALDWHLQSFLSKPLKALPPQAQNILRIGAYQLLYLDKVPARAAINEAVNSAKSKGLNGLSGVINGVLRNLERNKQTLKWPSKEAEPAKYLSVAYSHPLWMVERWLKRWNFAAVEALCQANNEPAPTWLRTNTLRINRDDLAARLRAAGVDATCSSRVPEGILISHFSAVEKLEPFQQGLCTVQDESSMLVAHVLGPEDGETIIDACSAPGGKTSHIAQLMQDRGTIRAFEIHPHKLQLVEGLCRRLGIDCVTVRAGDATRLSELVSAPVDRVLVDAPCSGLGVLRRKPDARWKKNPEIIEELRVLQLPILAEAAKVVKPGGTLVYSTCTIEPEENFEVVKAFRRTHPEFQAVDLNPVLPFELKRREDQRMAAKGYIQFLPHIHGMDGFFIARMQRSGV
ncbi:MAG TPA: 16S rRNA (cytosine(967)-C(5))-methyltransferase RsmB [Desulfobacteria bacterium]|nr:16S rRNA (cytosine(967)-C(5))-methyltransferase RsmB [Desulfobacteria bacterium]